MSITKIKKRTGQIAKFDKKRIESAIKKAFFEADRKNIKQANKITQKVIKEIKKYKVPSVEQIQDIIEYILKKENKKVWKAYHSFRLEKSKARKIGLKLPYNSLIILRERYLLRNEKGKIIETPLEMFKRVAKAIAKNKKEEKEFFDVLRNLEFIPNSPTLFNAGTNIGSLSACYVLPVPDSLKGIFEAVKNTAIIEQTGGGVGFDFSKLRPKGDIVHSTMRQASGPVSFMKVFDAATDVIKAAGRRRGAMMGILKVDHPDIEEFITIKSKQDVLSNFNISVAVTEKFMRAVLNNKYYWLINPRTNKKVKKIKARYIWNLIIENAWKTGDPGLLFIDEINKNNPTKHIGLIEATNPCGELALHPYESCNLGSINLVKMLKRKSNGYEIDWNKLKKTIDIGVRFLDNVIDKSRFPLPEIEKMTKANRRIGLGVMGFADALILLGIPYNSDKAIKTGEKIMKFIQKESHKVSAKLGLKLGSFPNFKGSLWDKKGYKAMRNATTTVIAPTGSTSIIAGVSSGIEPLFAVSFIRNVLDNKKLLEINPVFEKIAKEKGFYSTEIMIKIAKTGSIQNIKEIPNNIKRLFVTALDVDPKWHVKIQAAFQKYTDSSVSKTVNLKQTASKKDIEKTYMLAYKLKCKGITVYRYGSKKTQVLYHYKPGLVVESEYSGGCLTKVCHL
ncbi:MAG: adenosylcobalamin-dependent ribonucleoside-diphosphate reductase [Candidatus Aenigmarchaeota archaeon]|nr:adenosylcobalamin-dependent ribonucleoside-diphosphate reductase [Candidatus Aenigmarchaeota archaeon]